MSSRSILTSAPFSGEPSSPLTSPSIEEVCAKPARAKNRIPRAGKATLRYFMEPPSFGIAGIKFPVYYRAGRANRSRPDTPRKKRLSTRSSARAARDTPLLARQDLAHGVDTAPLALEVRAHHHFADQPGAEHHQAAQQQQAAGNHQGAVLHHDQLVAHQLIKHQPNHDQPAQARSSQAQRAEKVHGAGEVLQQELDGQDIEHHAEGAADSVVRIAR